MKENSRNNGGEVLLKGVKDKFHNSRDLAPNVPYELHDFCDYLAEVANDSLVPMGMMILLTCALDDLKNERCGFALKVDFPDVLKDEKYEIIVYMSWFPIIVDSFGNEKFAEEFREFFEQFICKAQPPVGKNQANFGVKIVKEGYVDISNKHKEEVLAALYNASHPLGMGILQYDPKPMTVSEAREILAFQKNFDYLKGRVLKVSLETNIINVSWYNENNGKGAAERAIATCPNIS